MIKIIAGEYKGRKLESVSDLYIRPTQAVVRKSMMQILEPLHGLVVLDLFAGVGTLGIEALSRGAKQVTFVDNNKLAINVLTKNIDLLCKNKDVSIIHRDVNNFIDMNIKKFDLIIADPPYAKADFFTLREMVKPMLNESGIFCMEMKKSKINDDSVRIKEYGSTQVVFWNS